MPRPEPAERIPPAFRTRLGLLREYRLATAAQGTRAIGGSSPAARAWGPQPYCSQHQSRDWAKTASLASVTTAKDFTCLDMWKLECNQMSPEACPRLAPGDNNLPQNHVLIISGACVELPSPASSFVFKIHGIKSRFCLRKMVVSGRRRRVSALAMCLAATPKAQAASINSPSFVTHLVPSPTHGSGYSEPGELEAGSVRVWDWGEPYTATTMIHSIVPHITAYPNGIYVTNNETVLATITLPDNVTASSTFVVSGFTMYGQHLTRLARQRRKLPVNYADMNHFEGPPPRYGLSTPPALVAMAE